MGTTVIILIWWTRTRIGLRCDRRSSDFCGIGVGSMLFKVTAGLPSPSFVPRRLHHQQHQPHHQHNFVHRHQPHLLLFLLKHGITTTTIITTNDDEDDNNDYGSRIKSKWCRSSSSGYTNNNNNKQYIPPKHPIYCEIRWWIMSRASWQMTPVTTIRTFCTVVVQDQQK